MNKLVKVRLLGDLGRYVKPEWNLAINSVKEAVHAINTLTNNSFSNYFIKQNKLQAKYRVIINGRDFTSPVTELNETNYEMVNQSELVMKKKDLETIDIVPVLESASKILGVLAIIIGVILIAFGGHQLIFAGLMLVMAGAMALISRPPEAGKFRSIDRAGGESYLFGGPVNIVGEGGPVPAGYGQAIVGSQVISSAFKIANFQTFRTDISTTQV